MSISSVDTVQIKLDRGAAVSTLEIDIEVPELKPAATAAAGTRENLQKADPAGGGSRTLPTGS